VTTKLTMTVTALAKLRWRCDDGGTLSVVKLFLLPGQKEEGPDGTVWVKSWHLMAKLGGASNVALAEVTAKSCKEGHTKGNPTP